MAQRSSLAPAVISHVYVGAQIEGLIVKGFIVNCAFGS
jgi:hypothetical protein